MKTIEDNNKNTIIDKLYKLDYRKINWVIVKREKIIVISKRFM